MKTEKDCFHTTLLFLQICHLSVYTSSALSLAPTPPSFLPVSVQSTPRSEREKEIDFFSTSSKWQRQKVTSKREKESERTGAQLTVLFWKKPRAAVCLDSFFFKVQTPSDQQNDSEKYFCYVPRSNIVPAADRELCPPC